MMALQLSMMVFWPVTAWSAEARFRARRSVFNPGLVVVGAEVERLSG
jgi:hypothetical protein